MTNRALWLKFRATVKARAKGVPLAGAALKAGLPKDAIRSVIKGHEPLLSRAEEVAHALGFGLEITPRPRPPATSAVQLKKIEAAARELNRALRDAGADPDPPQDRPRRSG